ncbi:MAG: zinc-ribbon domain-containing protein [Nitrospinae bacterium]|nr:zinc-ribbon domain-containing protein [Nitrospinota bacterium]
MLLTCPKCATRYEVDGSSIPQEGTYAHCATCENIFFVKKKIKAASKDVAKTTMPATQEQPAPQPVEAAAEVAAEATAPSFEAKPAPEAPIPPAKGKDGKERKDLTPEQVAAIMSGIEYEGKAKDEKNDSTDLTAQDQIDSILGNVHDDFKVITAPLPSAVAEKTAVNAGDIEALLASVQAQRPEEPVSAPKPAAKEEVGADDIAAILASVQAQQQAPKKEEPKMATASDIDDIFASVQAQQPAPAPAPKPAAKEEVGADDIAAILASVQSQQPDPKKEEPKTATASDIDDIFASVQAQQQAPAPAPKPAAKEEVGADDIAAILASVQSQQPPAPDNIDAIFAGANATPSAGKMDSQDDIDAILMTAAAPAPRESILEQEAVSSTQALSNNDIDSILAGAATEKESPAPAAPRGEDGNIISQSDLDSLFAAAAAPSAPAAEKPSKEAEGDLISQNDLDALLGETKAPSAAAEEPGDLVSQGDLDALMTGEGAPKAAAPVSAGQLLEEGNDELESLFAQEAGGSIAVPKAATAAAPAPEYEGVDTSMFEGLDKITAEEAPAAAEEHHAEAEKKPGTLSNIIAFIKNKLPKRKQKERAFTIEEEHHAEPDHGEAPKKKKAGMLVKIALPAAAGVALTLGAGWYYFVKPKSHPVVAAQKAAAPEKALPAPAQPVAEPQKETPPAETHAAPPPAHEEAKAEAPKAPPPPAHEEKKPEAPPAATAEAPKPKDAKEAAAAAHEDARKAALEAEKLIPPSLVEATIMKVGVMLPVDFNSSQVKMMTAEVELQFATASEFKTAEAKKFIYELALENEIEVFFKDKFYEETRYAKDKLMAYLFERIKKRGDLEKITGVNIAELALK